MHPSVTVTLSRFAVTHTRPRHGTSGRRPPRHTGRSVNHSVLARLARSANAPLSSDNTSVSFGLLNIRSLMGKGHLVQDLLTDCKLDFMCLNLTWQLPGDFSQLNDCTPPGFVYLCKPRGSGRRGGLAILYREKWKVAPVSVIRNVIRMPRLSNIRTHSHNHCHSLPSPQAWLPF